MRLGRTAITVVTPAVVPSESGLPVRSLDPADGATRRRVRGCNVQPVTAKVTLAGQTVETAGATIYAPAAAAVTDDDALEIDGEQYAIQGDPRPWRSRSGRGRFLVIDAIPWDRLETYWRHDTLVERLAGHGPTGAVLDPPVSVRGFVVPGARLVRAPPRSADRLHGRRERRVADGQPRARSQARELRRARGPRGVLQGSAASLHDVRDWLRARYGWAV